MGSKRKSMPPKHSTGGAIIRVLGVLAGCLGAGWLFSKSLQEFVELCTGYNIHHNFFEYFFTTSLFPLATLLIAALYFSVIIRDLEVLKRPLIIVSMVVSIVVIIAFAVAFFNRITTAALDISDYFFWRNLVYFFILFVYIGFCLYSLRVNSSNRFAWILNVITVIALICVAIAGYVMQKISAATFIYLIFTAASDFAVFFSGLRRY